MARPRPHLPVLLFCVGVSTAPAFAEAPDLERLQERIDGATLDFDRATTVVDAELPVEYGSLLLERGVLVPLSMPDEERRLELVFLGGGRLRVDAPDEIEAEQLALFTGERRLDVRIDRAVLIRGDGELGTLLAGRSRIEVDPETRAAATRLFEEWTLDAEREGFGARSALLRALAGDPTGAGYFALWFSSRETGRAFYAVDPTLKEPVSVGAFRLFEDEDFQSHRAQKLLRRAEKARAKAKRRVSSSTSDDEDEEEEDLPCGAKIQDEAFDPADSSTDDAWEWIRTWVSATRPGADPREDPPGFEPSHYEIELTLSGDELEAEGRADIEMSANANGLTVAELALADELEVCEVTDQDRRSLPFVQHDLRVAVGLAGPSVVGDALTLSIRFAGKPVRHWLARRTLQRTLHWYPHIGEIDHATYDFTLRWPEELTLLAGGEPVESGVEDGQRWTRRKVSVPTAGVSFEIGDYDVVEDRIGHMSLTFGFHRGDRWMTEQKRAEIVRTVKASLLFYEAKLGVLPIDQFVVTTVRRGFSQGLLGFVTLAEGALHHGGVGTVDDRTDQEVRLETIAHEVSHQWWGHMVGWDGYRDQWLSEGLADFSSTEFMGRIAEDPQRYMARHARLWRTELQATLLGGQPVASLGPVVLGRRLLWNHGPASYSAVVYSKGAAVFSTLGQRLGQDPLWEMLGALCKAVGHRVIRTPTFFAALERMSGEDLSGFVDQYVRGSGMPVLFYEWRTTRSEDGGWAVEGQVLQFPGASARYVVEPVEHGWDVVRHNVAEHDVADWSVTLPFRIEIGGAGSPRTGVQGNLLIHGEVSNFSVPVADRPIDFVLDPDGQVLAQLHAERLEPKRHLLEIGEHLVRIGYGEQATSTLERALQSRLTTAEQPSGGADAEADRARLDARIHLALARLALDRGDESTAKSELRSAESLFGDDDAYRGERVALATRLDLRRGRCEAAVAKLDAYFERYGLELETFRADRLLDASKSSMVQVSRGELMALYTVAQHEYQSKDTAMFARIGGLFGVDFRALDLPRD